MPEGSSLKPEAGLYTGAIKIVAIHDWWMKAGDRGTLENTVGALAPTGHIIGITAPGRIQELDGALVAARLQEQKAASKPVKPPGKFRRFFTRVCKTIDRLSGLKDQAVLIAEWKKAAAEVLKPVLEAEPKGAPVVFVSTGQSGIRPAFDVLRQSVQGPNLWLDVNADCAEYRYDHHLFPVASPTINAYLSEYQYNTPEPGQTGRTYVKLPHLPSRAGLPTKEGARESLHERYGLDPSRPVMAVLIGGHSGLCKKVVEAARVVGADLVVTTSPRSEFSESVRAEWQKHAKAFYEFREDSTEPNPYADFIAAADYIVADGQSISMPSDALGLGTPVALMFGGARLVDHKFAGTLVRTGFATMFDGAQTVWKAPPSHEPPSAMLNRLVRTKLANLVAGIEP